jgi:hypothetical protein
VEAYSWIAGSSNDERGVKVKVKVSEADDRTDVLSPYALFYVKQPPCHARA